MAVHSPSPRLRAAVYTLALLALSACGGGEATRQPTAAAPPAAASQPAGTIPPAAGAATPAAAVAAATAPAAQTAPLGATAQAAVTAGATGTTAPAAASGRFSNPVWDTNFPDPHVIKVGKTYHAYATNGPSGVVPTLTSSDLVNWTEGGDAMPQLAPWVAPGNTWAPEVLAFGRSKYVLYYTSRSAELDKQCLGRAVASKPEGPFVDDDDESFVCQPEEGGSIDASPFRDGDGSLYLLWKNDGNCCGLDTYLYSQQLSADGLKLVGKPKRLVKQDAAWEGALVEAPTLYKHAGKYYLFYSANAFYNETYAAGYATCRTPMGPCKDAPENPILATTECPEGSEALGATGPGHQTIIKDDDGDEWFVYHAWPPDAVESVLPGRVMWIDRLVWKNGKPDVLGPTCGEQRVP